MAAVYIGTFKGPQHEGTIIISEGAEAEAERKMQNHLAEYFGRCKYEEVVRILKSLKLRPIKDKELILVSTGEDY